MSDVELIALSALANVEAVLMSGDNAACAYRNEPPAWREGCGFMQYGTELAEELYRRKQARESLNILNS